jgi:hypothetical protein
MEPAATL